MASTEDELAVTAEELAHFTVMKAIIDASADIGSLLPLTSPEKPPRTPDTMKEEARLAFKWKEDAPKHAVFDEIFARYDPDGILTPKDRYLLCSVIVNQYIAQRQILETMNEMSGNPKSSVQKWMKKSGGEADSAPTLPAPE